MTTEATVDGIAEAIEAKRIQIAKLRAQIELLEEIARESRPRKAPAAGDGAARAGRPRRKRRPKGANQQQVLAAMTGKPQRLSVIAKAAGLGLPAAASVLQAAMKKALVEKGKVRGTYLLSKGAGNEATPNSSPSPSPKPKKRRAKRRARAATQ